MEELAAGASHREYPHPLHPRALACLIAFATLPLAGAEVDTTGRNQEFEPKPSKQERIEKKRTEPGETAPAANRTLEIVTAPAASAPVLQPAARAKKTAPVETTARTFPARKPGPARISTDRAAPSKFDKKVVTPTVTRIQDGMSDAGRVKTSKAKDRAKPSVLDRINRFVFRRNEATPATAPAGGENKPSEAAAAPSESSRS